MAHRIEPAYEERRSCPHDQVVGPIPGNILIAVGHAPESNERFHLVHVATHGLLDEMETPYIVINLDFKQVTLGVCYTE
jgi:hypothetical protein